MLAMLCFSQREQTTTSQPPVRALYGLGFRLRLVNPRKATPSTLNPINRIPHLSSPPHPPCVPPPPYHPLAFCAQPFPSKLECAVVSIHIYIYRMPGHGLPDEKHNKKNTYEKQIPSAALPTSYQHFPALPTCFCSPPPPLPRPLYSSPPFPHRIPLLFPASSLPPSANPKP